MFSNFKSMLQLIKKSKLALNLVVVILLFLLVYMGSSIAYKISQIKNESRATTQELRDTIRVTGKGELDVKPDVALINFGVKHEAKTIAIAQQKTNSVMNDIITALKNAGISEKDLKTTDYSIYPRYEYRENTGTRVLAGYEVSENIQVKIRDFAKIGSIIQEVTDLGANQTRELSFIIDDESKIRSDVRGLAIRNAKDEARTLARQLGIKLGSIVDFSEGGGYYPVYYEDQAIGSTEMLKAPAPDIEPGTNRISAQVYLTYEILK